MKEELDSSEYYQEMRELALFKRKEYDVKTSDICLSRIRKIYKEESIEIYPNRRKLKKLRGAYFNDKGGSAVLLNMALPVEPRLFTMIHELKHHYTDRNQIGSLCLEVNKNSPVLEIGAEVFAAEYIFPLKEFEQYLFAVDVTGKVTPEDIVRLKYHSPVMISYQFIQKRLEWLRLIGKNQFRNVKFKKLHKDMYGAHYLHDSWKEK